MRLLHFAALECVGLLAGSHPWYGSGLVDVVDGRDGLVLLVEPTELTSPLDAN